ncbi:hypothetical protein IDH44_15265 [Paenibacillus sp. IB182496]|uniref:Uncharacterized protein n=1 Tax=Paenibacillus sabuli TaxID=2772509 RepID=A0A927GSH0_9BACL|nr:hypothetical protein [Paenibacillus sabuli]MBD2846558.1 hypothetical protein [Paenibacillus sabuli]
MSFDDLLKDLQGQKTIQEDPSRPSLEKLFPASFMRKHSRFNSFREFQENGNFQADTLQDIEKISGELFDRHIDRETDFPNWKTMLESANREFERGK